MSNEEYKILKQLIEDAVEEGVRRALKPWNSPSIPPAKRLDEMLPRAQPPWGDPPPLKIR